MRHFVVILLAVFYCSLPAVSQTAEELVAKNIEAKGGAEKIKALNTIRMTGRVELQGGTNGSVSQENKRAQPGTRNLHLARHDRGASL